jgi:hypothetical protein
MGETMHDQLVLIHTVPPLIEVFNRLGARLLPGVKLFHILDEPLLEQVRLQGGIQAEQIARLQGHVEAAQDIAASAVLVTCSTLSPALDQVHAVIPLFKIDQVMIEQAVRRSTHLGVIATNQTTLEPTRQSLQAEAKRAGKIVEISQIFVEGALPALLNGEGARHDELVHEAVKQLAGEVEVILLAQASMARVMEVIPEGGYQVPILTSPHTVLEQVGWVLTHRRKL